jgi:uncharacterized iron-regulated protein
MNSTVMKRVLTIVCPLILSACSFADMGAEKPVDEQAPLLFSDHPMAEKIWDVQGRHFVAKEQLLADALSSRHLLLGETHDNVLHHRYETWILDALAAQKKSAAVSFEMISRDQLAPLAGRQPASTKELITTLNKVKTSWGYEQFYRPLFASVLRAGYPLFAASLGRSELMAIARGGKQHIPQQVRPLLEKTVLSPEQQSSLREEIKQSHCGMLDDRMAAMMVSTQQVKDAVMAQSMLQQSTQDVRVLVAGSGHGRKDRGVPLYLRSQDSTGKIVSIAWIEVVPDMTKVVDYARAWGSETLPYDYVWFTARVGRPDPCESFKRHMHKKRAEPAKQRQLDKTI